MKKGLGHIVFLIIFLSMSSCGEYETLEIQKQAQRTADSTYRVHRDSLIKIFDEECTLRYDSIYQDYFDSMLVVEKNKILKLIEK